MKTMFELMSGPFEPNSRVKKLERIKQKCYPDTYKLEPYPNGTWGIKGETETGSFHHMGGDLENLIDKVIGEIDA